MLQHNTSYITSYYGILCLKMSFITASLDFLRVIQFFITCLKAKYSYWIFKLNAILEFTHIHYHSTTSNLLIGPSTMNVTCSTLLKTLIKTWTFTTQYSLLPICMPPSIVHLDNSGGTMSVMRSTYQPNESAYTCAIGYFTNTATACS